MTKPTVASTKKVAKSVALPTSVVDKDKEIELLTARLSNMETMLNKVLFQLGMNEPMVQKTNKKKLISFIGLMNLDNPDLSEPHLVCDEEELVCKVISMKKDKLAELCQCVLDAEDGDEIELVQDEFTITDRLCSKIDDGKYGFIQ